MTINELRQLTFFRHADIHAINKDNNDLTVSFDDEDLTVSFDDEIVDILEIEVGYVVEKYGTVSYPRKFIRVYCVVKHV